MKITNNMGCKHRQYELCRLKSLSQAVSRATDHFDFNQHLLNKNEEEDLKSYFKEVSVLKDQMICLKNNIENEQDKHSIWRCTDQLCAQIKLILKMIKNHLPVFRPRVIELTDGGPRVSVGNHDIQFRLAERARIINADYLIRLHLASGDSSQNEVERCQSYLGDAICDGGSISWEYALPFEGISEDKLKEMSSEHLEESELMRMEYNAYKVCEEISSRIDGARGPGGYLKCYVSVKADELFFSDHEYLSNYIATSDRKKHFVLGGCYHKKLEDFIKLHCEKGEKYMEFLKFSCAKATDVTSPCNFCADNQWIGPPCDRVPRPVPNYELLPDYHYRHVSDTSLYTDNGCPREPDDFQPRQKINQAFQFGTLSASDEDQLNSFCDKFIVEKSFVLKRLAHLQVQETFKSKRKEQRIAKAAEEDNKQYKDYNWFALVDNNKFGKTRVKILDKYLVEHSMRSHLKLRKQEKVDLIKHHVLRRKLGMIAEKPSITSNQSKNHKEKQANITDDKSIKNDTEDDDEMISDTDSDIDEEDDEVLDYFDDSRSENDNSDEDSDEGMELENDLDELFTKTRSGRIAGTWRISNYL